MRSYLMAAGGTLLLAAFSVAGDDLAKRYGIPPAGWFRALGKDGYQVGIDKTEKHEGEASAFIKSIAADRPASAVGLEQAIEAEKYRGKRLRMSAYIKTKEVEGSVQLFMRIDSKEQDGVSFDNMQDRKIKGTGDWKKYESVLDVPNDAVAINFGFVLAGKGQAWADNFRLDVVGKDVKTTQQAVEPSKRNSPLGREINKEPTNLDFEILKNPKFLK